MDIASNSISLHIRDLDPPRLRPPPPTNPSPPFDQHTNMPRPNPITLSSDIKILHRRRIRRPILVLVSESRASDLGPKYSLCFSFTLTCLVPIPSHSPPTSKSCTADEFAVQFLYLSLNLGHPILVPRFVGCHEINEGEVRVRVRVRVRGWERRGGRWELEEAGEEEEGGGESEHVSEVVGGFRCDLDEQREIFGCRVILIVLELLDFSHFGFFFVAIGEGNLGVKRMRERRRINEEGEGGYQFAAITTNHSGKEEDLPMPQEDRDREDPKRGSTTHVHLQTLQTTFPLRPLDLSSIHRAIKKTRSSISNQQDNMWRDERHHHVSMAEPVQVSCLAENVVTSFGEAHVL
ncbi:uncharacterized protein A4U43_C03F7710 [Asparagus officinalis]|uniref:Uncharacterized protein n=1 Tax=Asparagus officinalis TaxID=4686 RepID=A0A5P1F8Q9_ASPOF|nr:uncharacterized protein A4U43_C03F7710 [Asparagus officinalis]